MQAPNILFVILDGARARFVKRAGPRRDLTTFHEIDGSWRLKDVQIAARGRPATRTFHTAGRASQTPTDDDLGRQAKEAFAAEVAALTPRIMREQSLDVLYVVAPARLLKHFQSRLPADAKLAGQLARDLTKTPDCELPKWLHPPPTLALGGGGDHVGGSR